MGTVAAPPRFCAGGSRPYRVVGKRQLPVWLLACLLALDVLGFMPTAEAAAVGAAIALLAIDSRGLVSLNGWIPWRRIHGLPRLGLAIVMLVLYQWVVLVYLIQKLAGLGAARASAPVRQTVPATRPARPAPQPPAAPARTDLGRALDARMAAAGEQFPAAINEKLQAIRNIVGAILPAYEAGSLAAGDRYAVERTVDEYLPTALQHYLRLPVSYRSVPLTEAGGRTATDVLADQLDLLTHKMREVAEATHRTDVEALLVHGRFLDLKFGPTELELPRS